MNRFFSIITSRWFLLNLLAASAVAVLIVGFTYKWLDSYTNHGNTITVPDLSNMTVDRAEQFLKNKSLRIKIADSSVFDLNKLPRTVIEQDPAAGQKVKDNRTIYVSITRSNAPSIKFPDLEDVSLRQAEAILKTYGLVAGKISYKPDLCKNCVLTATVNGRTLKKGDELQKGTTVDLILGDGIGNIRIPVPDLNGLTLEEALFVLKGSGLNIGAIINDKSVKDSLRAFVVRQVPEALPDAQINQGEAVDVYLSPIKPE
jgi:beta-lactam-binding protein with PASTA domain